FRFDDEAVGQTSGWPTGPGSETVPYQHKILVPFTFESALSGIGKGKEIHEHILYRRKFEVPSSWKGKRVLLHFGAVDWDTTVFVTATKIGAHRGGYTPF